MGQSVLKLANGELSSKSIFNNRFVIEICERVHVHYRNIRLNLSMSDFIEMGNGFMAACMRWKRQGEPSLESGKHIELCRKRVGRNTHNDGIQINLNKNLYNCNKDKIYAEGAGFKDKHYIHLKWRDMRVECSIDEFKIFSEVVKEARERLCLEQKDSSLLTICQGCHTRLHRKHEKKTC